MDTSGDGDGEREWTTAPIRSNETGGDEGSTNPLPKHAISSHGVPFYNTGPMKKIKKKKLSSRKQKERKQKAISKALEMEQKAEVKFERSKHTKQRKDKWKSLWT